MQFDVVFRRGLVIDGSGAAGVHGDVGVVGDTIAAVGDLNGGDAAVEVDCEGLAITPGFIDIHTHYDAQLFWDPRLTPSSWHGVTSVLMGNCGFGIAPTRAEDQELSITTLETVEGMSGDALREGIRWNFDDYASYIAAIRDEPLALNVAALVPHTPLRVFVMGEAAFEREAEPDEIVAMQRALGDAMAAGAYGFSSSKAPSHVAFGGRPIPSRLAANEEIYELAESIRGSRGMVQVIGCPGFGVPEFRIVAERFGGPVTWTSLRTSAQSDRHWGLVEQTEQIQRDGVGLWAQMGCIPVSTLITFANPYNVFESLDAFGKLGGTSREERSRYYADDGWRAAAYKEMVANAKGLPFTFDWTRIFVEDSPTRPELVGSTAAEVADQLGSATPLDAMADLSLDDGLTTRFRFLMFDYDEDVIGALLQRESIILGLSDGGAHASQLCDASYCTYLLGHWVRELGALPLEFAVWRLTGHIADTFGFADRGLLEKGRKADVCVFDPATVDQGQLERVYDFPAGAERLIRRPAGIQHVLVNGEFIRRDGQQIDTSAPGRVLH